VRSGRRGTRPRRTLAPMDGLTAWTPGKLNLHLVREANEARPAYRRNGLGCVISPGSQRRGTGGNCARPLVVSGNHLLGKRIRARGLLRTLTIVSAVRDKIPYALSFLNLAASPSHPGVSLPLVKWLRSAAWLWLRC
jgi:hypothetical protein